jgi:hypothetical protein
MRRSRIVVAAASGTLGIGLVAPLAAHADTAPPGSASGTGASLSLGGQPVAAVSPTSASAGGGGTSASAYTVQVAGNNVTPAGSSQNGQPASSQGSALSTPAGSPVEAEVTPYSASTSPGSATAQAAAAHAAAGGSSGVSADVLRSDSSASYDSSRSSGHSSTDGAVVNAGGSGGLTLDLLHSQTDSTSGASAYVASLNGTQIGSSQDVGQICSSLSNSLLRLACVVASGGEAFVGQAASPGGTGGGSALNILLLDATGSGAPGAVPAVATSSGSPAEVGAAGPSGSTATTIDLPVVPAGPAVAVTPSHTNGGNLPFTGAPIEFWVLVSGALLALGGVVWRLSTVVRPTFVA